MTEWFNRLSEKATRRRLRRQMPKAEVILWSRLRAKQILGQRFRRQYSVGPYVVDFYCPDLKLAIEIDGESHYREGAAESDQQRQAMIESFGICFRRFTNLDIYENLDGVLEVIARAIQER